MKISLTIILCLTFWNPIRLTAESPNSLQNTKWHYITGNYVRVREHPTLDARVLFTLCAGESVTIVDTGPNTTIDGFTAPWFRIEYTPLSDPKNPIRGYVWGKYVVHPSRFNRIHPKAIFVVNASFGDGNIRFIYSPISGIYSSITDCYPDHNGGVSACATPQGIKCLSDPTPSESVLSYCVANKLLYHFASSNLYESGRVRFASDGEEVGNGLFLDETGHWQPTIFAGNCRAGSTAPNNK